MPSKCKRPLYFMVTKDEAEYIKKCASERHMYVSQFMREAISAYTGVKMEKVLSGGVSRTALISNFLERNSDRSFSAAEIAKETGDLTRVVVGLINSMPGIIKHKEKNRITYYQWGGA